MCIILFPETSVVEGHLLLDVYLACRTSVSALNSCSLTSSSRRRGGELDARKQEQLLVQTTSSNRKTRGGTQTLIGPGLCGNRGRNVMSLRWERRARLYNKGRPVAGVLCIGTPPTEEKDMGNVMAVSWTKVTAVTNLAALVEHECTNLLILYVSKYYLNSYFPLEVTFQHVTVKISHLPESLFQCVWERGELGQGLKGN